MRILVVGAGSIGGYFGGRLIEAGQDVTFLVRPRRAAQLARTGLIVTSSVGDITVPAPALVTADTLRTPFDLILLSCKAYDLDDAMESFAPAVGAGTAILPLLNGMRHIEALEARFGAEHVLGGQCMISTVLDADGRILHLNDVHKVSFGERDGVRTPRIEAVAAAFATTKVEGRLSDTIVQDMWQKWVFIATGAGSSCLMRAAIGDIVAAGGAGIVSALLDECASIATAEGFPPDPDYLARTQAMFTTPGSLLTASMLRDLESGARVEADHILGDLLRRSPQPSIASPLRIAYAHVKAYEARRDREARVAS